MQELRIQLGESDTFDNVVHGRDGVTTLRDGGDLRVVTKDGATDQGRAIACLSFTVEVDGKLVRAKTVTTVQLLVGLMSALVGRYGYDGKPRAAANLEELRLDALNGMPAAMASAVKEDILKLAVQKLGGTFAVSTADSVTAQKLALHVGFDAKAMGFIVETKRAQ
jgi:hypothetical protein